MSARWFFLRGLIRESGHWAGFLERFEKAFPGTRAIGIDIPGNGRRWKDASPTRVALMAEAAREEFLRQRGDVNSLFALSLGGMIGIEWMSRWPEDFVSCALVNTSLRGLSPLWHRLRPRNYGRILRIATSADPALKERIILEMTSNRPEKISALHAEWVRIREERPVSGANSVRQLFAASRFRPPLAKPAPRVMVLNGGGDRLVNPRCSEALANHWNLELRRHPTAGHDLTLDEPEWVIEQLRSF
jgi:pimeloyl-ACP methyl ester carboxylesterase